MYDLLINTYLFHINLIVVKCSVLFWSVKIYQHNLTHFQQTMLLHNFKRVKITYHK